MSARTLAKVEVVAECGSYVHLTGTKICGTEVPCDESDGTSASGKGTDTIPSDDAFHVVVQSEPIDYTIDDSQQTGEALKELSNGGLEKKCELLRSQVHLVGSRCSGI